MGLEKTKEEKKEEKLEAAKGAECLSRETLAPRRQVCKSVPDCVRIMFWGQKASSPTVVLS